MARLGLAPEYIEAIKADPLLQGEVAAAMGVSTLTLPMIFKRNDIKLTGIAVLILLRKRLAVSKLMDLLVEIEEPVNGVA